MQKELHYREKLINIKIIYSRQIKTHYNATTFQHMEGATCAQHRFVHLTLKYMKYSTYVCGVNEYPICVCTRYVNVP